MVQIEMAWKKKRLYVCTHLVPLLLSCTLKLCSLPTEGFNHGQGLIAEECSIAKVMLRELTRGRGRVVDEGSGRC